MLEDIKKDALQRMQKCIQTFQGDLKKLRTGRAHPSLVENLKIDFYGSETPLSQVANIAIEDARTIVITPWDKNTVSAVEKAIHKSDLHLTPMTAGSVIRVPLPPLTEERRRDILKVVRQDAEAGKVSVRNVRRDVLSDVKEALKAKLISQDDERRVQDDIQKLTDRFTGEIDQLVAGKEKEILQV
jgi:ribosome recycling factor